jgi:hypothetical protein
MPLVLLTGWHDGLQKVALTKLIREQAGMRLANAKECTNQLLAGERVALRIPAEHAAKFLAEAEFLGAIGYIAERSDLPHDDTP